MLTRKKNCTGCKKAKSAKEFHKDKSTQDGYTRRCKSCIKTYDQSEKGKEATKRHSQSDKRKQSNKQYNQSVKGKKSRKQFNQSEKGKQATGKYIQSEKGRLLRGIAVIIRRTRETQAGGSYTPTEWYNLCKFYDFRCLKCNKKFPFEKLTLDHVKPVSKGGSSFIWNTQPLCLSCNSSKGDKEIDYRKTLPDWINRDDPVWIQDSLF